MAAVKVSQGALRGGRSETESGVSYYEFLAVPYAKPPIGDLRFKSPQPPEPWINERDATQCHKNHIICSQVDLFKLTSAIGSEDCLYLNVYTPQLPAPGSIPLPVIVYIHGGGFVVGNGILKSENGPDHLLEQHVVVVTINYRLGPLGFLSLDIPEAAGNMGLKDQVKALEWVRANISNFGGDNNNVTIMGLSAGASSVEYLMLSSKAKGLFHKAILQSGSTLNHWAINFQPVNLARELAKSLDYKGSLDDNESILKFLHTVPVSSLTLTASQVAAKYSSKTLFCGFVPTVEKDYGNGEAFLTSSPYKLLKEGNFTRVPVLRGFCAREDLTSILNPSAKKNLLDTQELLEAFPYDIESTEKVEYNKKFTAAYSGDQKFDEKIVEEFFGDLDFISGIWIAGKFLSKKVPVYMYRFEHAGKINGFKRLFGLNLDEPGAMHSDDFTYVFKRDGVDGADENDVLVRKRVVTMFTNFAKLGKPVVSTSDLIPLDWPTFSEESQVYLGINDKMHLLSNYQPEKMEIFEALYAKVYGK